MISYLCRPNYKAFEYSEVFINKNADQPMRKIVEYRKLMGADKDISLNDLKTLYRNFMKEFHPDKFQDEELRKAAEEKSKLIIEAYHTLVSIAAETRDANLEAYNTTISNAGIAVISYKS